MIAEGNYYFFIFFCIVHLCTGVWVTTNLTVDEIDNIFTSARDQGRSNAELMYQWTEESKGEVCKSVFTSDPIAAMKIKYLDKSDHLMSEQEIGSDIFERHYLPLDNDQQEKDAELESFTPIYPLSPKAIVVGGKLRQISSFPCLVMIDDFVEEIYIADGYLEKTYTILTEKRTLEEDSEEEITLSVIGFVEIPPERPPAADQETLEESYFMSLSALQVNSFVCWEEDESLINPISTLSEKEKLKLCSLVNDAIHSNVGGWIAGVEFKIADFEHGPITFIELERSPPKLKPPHQNVRGIECQYENINFILVPNWLHRNGTFVLKYIKDSEAPDQMIAEVSKLKKKRPGISHSLEEEQQEASTSRKRKSSELRDQAEVPEASSKEGKLSTEPVSIFQYVEGVSFLVNKENGIRIVI